MLFASHGSNFYIIPHFSGRQFHSCGKDLGPEYVSSHSYSIVAIFILPAYYICDAPSPAEMQSADASQVPLQPYVEINWLWVSRVMREPWQGKGQGRTSRILFPCLAKSCFLPFKILFLSICTWSQMPPVSSWHDRTSAMKVLPGITSIREVKCSTGASISQKDQKRCWFLFSGILGDFWLSYLKSKAKGCLILDFDTWTFSWQVDFSWVDVNCFSWTIEGHGKSLTENSFSTLFGSEE